MSIYVSSGLKIEMYIIILTFLGMFLSFMRG